MTKLIAIVIQALVIVESEGNPQAISPSGSDWGILQITQVCLDDVNRIERLNARKQHRTPRRFSKQDCFNPHTSREIATIYLTYWGAHYERTQHKKIDARHLALIWNAGPYQAIKISRTRDYWLKVRRQLGNNPEYHHYLKEQS